MSLPRVLLTNPIDPTVARQLALHFDLYVAAATDALSLKSAASDASFIVVRAPLPDDLFANAPRLRGVVRHGAGLDMINVDAASRHGVAVANVPAVNAVSVAEYAVGQMLNLARHLTQIDATLRSTSWAAARSLGDRANDLQGKTVAIVGMGAIGQALSRICATGFGMRVLGIRRSQVADSEFLRYVTLSQALPEADYLVLACPLSRSTRGLISTAQLANMKPGARLINVARGPVVDEAALALALQSGTLAGAALDVFSTQPLPVSSPLLGLPNVLLSPHLAGITQESMRRMSEGVASQLLEMQSGRLPCHFVNPEAQQTILARWSTLPHS